MRIIKDYQRYTLLIGDCPCDVFKYFNVNEMHGLRLDECEAYDNTADDAYIAGLCNYSPIDDKVFVFINLTRCRDDISLTATIMHEMMHLSYKTFVIFNEEEFITFAENETYKAIRIIKDENK
jgi:hypothetical protein